MAILARPVNPAPLALAAALLAAPAAHAGEAPCWYENGVVVVSASVAGVEGDFILDTATPRTQLAETQAQAAGHEGSAVVGDVRMAGLIWTAHPSEVADLDVRTGLHPTPIAGVLGADLLAGKVLDVSFSPCRIGVWPAGRAPRFRASATLPLEAAGELHAIRAAVSDGEHSHLARLVPATGADAPLRLSEKVASAPPGEKPEELYPYGVRRPRLRALAFAGELWEDLPAGLLKPEALAADGWLGGPVLERFAVRFDFAQGRLQLAPAQRKKPRREPGP